MTTGTINVQADNIFPIIKKFLYSEHEIFLRELVSNAVDATQKLKTLASVGDFKGELGELKIEVLLDKEAGTLTVKDRGIGMTEREVEKYINEIAFSGAEEFLKKYKDKTGIIGHFGLGFYSSFMVADKVEIFTKSHKKAKAVSWSCSGNPEYVLKAAEKKERGTDVVLHISGEASEYLEDGKVEQLLRKYSGFVPVDVVFKGEVINNAKPAWTQKPAELKEEDYKNFYKELYPHSFEEPLFNIHLNVDYPFNLTGILYFPKLKGAFEMQRNKIQLYCNQVYVTDSVENIVPDFLTLLHGVIDSPDIPLNVSRSYLQGDPNVKKISAHITRKVADKLEDLFKKDRKDFEQKWEDIRMFVEYGMIMDEKFFERSGKFALYKNVHGDHRTFEELEKKIKAAQTDKDGKLVVIYTTNPDEQHAYISAAGERNYEVIELTTPLAAHLVGKLEQGMEKVKFVCVDSDAADKLIQKDEAIPSKLSDSEKDKLRPVIENVVDKSKFNVVFESMPETDQPFTVTQPEFSRRMKDMNALAGGAGTMPEMYNLLVNNNHPLVVGLLKEKDKKKREQKIRQMSDLAMLAQNMLKGEQLTEFVRKSIETIK